jgi:hypothetical protein
MRTAMKVLLGASAIALSYFMGGVSGFGKGFAAAQYSASTDSLMTAVTLVALGKGKTNEAIDLLETRLWSQLQVHPDFRDSYRSVFNLPFQLGIGSPATTDELVFKAAKYWQNAFPEKRDTRLGKVAYSVVESAKKAPS